MIVEGPAIYAADACNGGALVFGKLTVRGGKIDRANQGTVKKP